MTGPRFGIRATRARPPGIAGEDPLRWATYGAALAQFDELMDAADAASFATRPLPLFYAISQAGRAIAAAYAKSTWKLEMHGLVCPDLSPSVVDVRVDRRPVLDRPGVVDSFSGVAKATQSDAYAASVEVGALWASLPEIAPLLPWDRWTEPLRVVPEPPSRLSPRGSLMAVLVGFAGRPEALMDFLRANYPTASAVRVHEPAGLGRPVEKPTDFGVGVEIFISAESYEVTAKLAALDRLAPGGSGFEPRWLRPAVGGVALSPLLTWWALLFGLSMLARYEPAGWTAALNLDRSEIAAPLQEVLEVALGRLPELVYGQLADRAR